MNEPKVGDSIFEQNGLYVTDIGAIIGHIPKTNELKVFGRNGKKYLIVRYLISNNIYTKTIVTKELE